MINRTMPILIWGVALGLSALAIVLARRGESVADFVAIVTAGKLNVIAARDAAIVITLSDHHVSRLPRWGVHLDRTTPANFDADRRAAKAESQFSFAGFRSCIAERVVNSPASASVAEIQFPQWVLALPLLLLIARWYRRVCVRSARMEAGRCIVCAYDLRGSESPRCPECGCDTTMKSNPG
ncbi:MAG: hypothetical protein H7Z14_09125 [Anaerolineae bacterium]|nr:hypothetical protein [Phycisphaerae bacterium]